MSAQSAIATAWSNGAMHRLLNTSSSAWDWDWSQLNPLAFYSESQSGFEWEYGTTPFADLKILAGTLVLYWTTIFSLKRFMASREKFDLKYVVALHNLILTVWSLVMFIFASLDLFDRYKTHGWYGVFCGSVSEKPTGRFYFGLYLYYVSKYYELFDTVLLVLKKKPLIFLHWYHHSIVMVMVFLWCHEGLVLGGAGMIFNTLVHVFMYYYYLVAALGGSVWFKRYITQLQIVQFVTSFLLLIPTFYFSFQQETRGSNALYFSMFCNFSFLVLFVQFYRQSYSGAQRKPQRESQRVKEE